MEFQKIVNFLDTTSDNKNLPTFVTKKQIEVYDQSEGTYNINKKIGIKTSMLRSDLCDFSANNTANNNELRDKKLVFKNNAPFINSISKINGVKIDYAEDLDVLMPMYNLLEYS